MFTENKTSKFKYVMFIKTRLYSNIYQLPKYNRNVYTTNMDFKSVNIIQHELLYMYLLLIYICMVVVACSSMACKKT